ncbi:prion-like-(Q/N-rich) domain-bearing protein 25, partial [Biomphalaria pfeifferi]
IGYTHYSNSEECGYLVSPSSMTTGSLNYWTINGVSGTYVTIVVLDIDMDSTHCSTNYLEILEGSTHLLNKTCDRSDSTLRFHATNSSSLSVYYRKASSAYRGFRAIYYTRSLSSMLYESMGYIVSPGYPVSYNNYMNCTWLISAASGSIISATFLVDTESCCDYVRVYDGRDVYSRSLANFSGSLSLRSVRSSANYMFIQFKTDGSVIRTGFRATYEVYVLYGYSCSSSDKCDAGLVCTGNTCTCLSNQYYDSSTKTCTSRLGYGNICTTNTMCASRFTCLNGYCQCTSTQYFDPSNEYCNSRHSYGSYCPFGEECLEGLVCRDSVCRCSTSQYYDTSARVCKSGVSFGNNCYGLTCVEGLSCNSGVCNCSSSHYYDHSFRICKSRITYGNTCNSTDQCVSGLTCNGARCSCLTTHYYNQSSSSCFFRLTHGSYCTSTSQCHQDLECTGLTCKCSSNSYYNNRTCLAKLSHAVTCSTSEQCLTPYVCRDEKYFTKTCLCPINMFLNTWNCLNESTVRAEVSNSSIVKIDSILLKWTTQTWKSNFFFTVGWGGNTFYPNSSEYYVDGLSPGRTYIFTISTNIPADNYYNNKSVQSNISVVTKQPPGFACNSYYKCSDEASCVSGVCVCSNQFYLSELSKACEPRLTKGYECSQTDECKETLKCIHRRCDCQSGYYYDNNRPGCYGALKKGQFCDPSIANICELPHFICARENTSTISYTCQRNQNANDTDDIVFEDKTSEDNHTVFIAVAVVGWVAALAAVIAVFVVCSMNRKKSSTNGSLETQTITAMSDRRGFNNSSVPPKNDYKAFPTSTDLQSTTSTSAPDVSQVQSTVPAMAFAKPSTSAKTNNATVSVKPKFVYDNKTYTPDLAKKNESQYDEIDMEQISAYIHDDNNEQVYQNVQIQKENVYNNSNI